MESRVLPLGMTNSRFVRLRFPQPVERDGVVQVSGRVGDPAEPLVVSVWSVTPRGIAPDFVIEESRDGVMWVETDGTPSEATPPGGAHVR